MSRWRFAGAGWRSAKSIVTLGGQIESVWPAGNSSLDGTVNSSGHAGWPLSDHGIDPQSLVRAIDVYVATAEQGETLFQQLLATEDERIRYVIHNRRIFSSYISPWVVRPYNKHPHDEHVHISVMRDARAEDPAMWDINLGGDTMFTVLEWQQMLNAAGRTDPDGNPLEEDGIKGPKTEYAMIQALTADEAGDHEHDDLASVKWTKGLVDRKTANVLYRNDVVRLRPVTETKDPANMTISLRSVTETEDPA